MRLISAIFWLFFLSFMIALLLLARQAHAAGTLYIQPDYSTLTSSFTSNGQSVDIPLSNLGGAQIDSVTVRAAGRSGAFQSYDTLAFSIYCYTDAADTVPCPGVGVPQWAAPGHFYQFQVLTPYASGQQFYTANFRTGDAYSFPAGVPAASTTLPVGYHSAFIRVEMSAGSGNDLFGTGATVYADVEGAAPTVGTTTSAILSVDPPDQTGTSTPFAPSMVYYTPSAQQAGFLQLEIVRLDQGGTAVYSTTTQSFTQDGLGLWQIPSLALPDNAAYEATWSIQKGLAPDVLAYLVEQGGNVGASDYQYQTLAATSTFFYTGTNPLPTLIGASSTNAANLAALATSTCSIANISGCFQNALVWAFVPSSDSIQNIAQAGQQIAGAPPASWFYTWAGALGTLTASSTPYFALGTSTAAILTVYLAPLSGGLLVLFWVAFLVGFYFGTARLIHAVL